MSTRNMTASCEFTWPRFATSSATSTTPKNQQFWIDAAANRCTDEHRRRFGKPLIGRWAAGMSDGQNLIVRPETYFSSSETPITRIISANLCFDRIGAMAWRERISYSGVLRGQGHE